MTTISRVDHLTGLGTYHGMIDGLRSRVLRNRPFALIYFDVDRLRALNYESGHQVGDCWLVEVAATIRRIAPQSASTIRAGGDEFAVLLETDRADALSLAERLRAGVAAVKVEAMDDPDGPSVAERTISVGVAFFPEDARSSDELLLAATDSAWAAKLRGGDQVITVPDALLELGARRLPRGLDDFFSPPSLS